MKQIIKGEEPQAFVEWKRSKKYEESKNDKLKVEEIYDRFKKSQKVKTPVKNSLMVEQGYICCYCERRIGADDSHIEHLIPRYEYQKSLDFDNLLCSCQKDLEVGEPRHCGNSKSNDILPISPLNPDCETRFIFAHDGQILPAQEDDEQAKNTIEILQLNIPKLKALRQGVINAFLDPNLSDQELRTFISDYLEINSQGEFGEFWTTIQHLFGGFLD